MKFHFHKYELVNEYFHPVMLQDRLKEIPSVSIWKYFKCNKCSKTKTKEMCVEEFTSQEARNRFLKGLVEQDYCDIYQYIADEKKFG